MTRETTTTVTPLPATVTRECALDILHSHSTMIQMNPLVTSHSSIPPPMHAAMEELEHAWYSVTDRIPWFPRLIPYTACFCSLAHGLSTHVFAPMGVELRNEWSICGSEEAPNEDSTPDNDIPVRGLYIRETVVMSCHWLLAGVVRKNIKKSHGVLVDRIGQHALVHKPQPALPPIPTAVELDAGQQPPSPIELPA